MPSATMLDAPANAAVDTPSTDPFHARNAGPCGRYWAVAHTHPQAERWAEQNLTTRGYPVYLPTCLVRRRDPVLRSLTRQVEAVLFPRYLFVAVDAHWTPARYTPGVAALLMAADTGKPAQVPHASVEALQAATAVPASGGVNDTPWVPGAPCALSSGPLEGHPAVVLSVGSRKARVAVLLFGSLVTATATLGSLRSRDQGSTG